ncbi:MAG: SRPBCC family protein [Actinobacteria bacterium]|nr:SRPBCC family protein [Actinomycetota bacterium]MBV9254267.1 SRPBCC family protein [Actinomycetota bacterium]MBV9664333.1 SRPBCC family protein [Actinomycetota bacterium]MBV9936109.1 SRPBCC family protein [Actinomycetota bacterium]
MELTNSFRVGLPVGEAWAVLTDVERIAPCLPGAQLQEVEGDEYRGVVKVKVGPITAQYKGKATFQNLDVDNHVAVLRAEGRDTRGQGNANATITATLTPDGDGTAVQVVTDLAITGRVAQFGRGTLADVSTKLLNQFVECLESTVMAAPAGGAAPPPPAKAAEMSAAPVVTAAPPEAHEGNGHVKPSAPESDGVRRIEHAPSEPVDLLDAAGVPVAKRAIPIVAGVLLIALFLRSRRKRRNS